MKSISPMANSSVEIRLEKRDALHLNPHHNDSFSMLQDNALAGSSPALPLAQAMILAAGRGERMRPLTDTCPKPLLQVRGQPLMLWPMQALHRQGFSSQLINTAWLGGQIEAYFLSKNGHQPLQNVRQMLSNSEHLKSTPDLRFSHEGRDFGGALETAGGIVRALPQLAEVFWVVAGDVFMPEFEFSRTAFENFAKSDALAHLWLVPNPPHNPRGDFGLSPDGKALNLPKDAGHALHTFSTVALYKRAFFAPPFCDIPAGNPQGTKAALAPMLRTAMDAGRVTAQLYESEWTDVGTPERLAQLNAP
jgi:N-acetyl-alpha-D-muramate 1-phosphate uridylyltransferase